MVFTFQKNCLKNLLNVSILKHIKTASRKRLYLLMYCVFTVRVFSLKYPNYSFRLIIIWRGRRLSARFNRFLLFLSWTDRGLGSCFITPPPPHRQFQCVLDFYRWNQCEFFIVIPRHKHILEYIQRNFLPIYSTKSFPNHNQILVDVYYALLMYYI